MNLKAAKQPPLHYDELESHGRPSHARPRPANQKLESRAFWPVTVPQWLSTTLNADRDSAGPGPGGNLNTVTRLHARSPLPAVSYGPGPGPGLGLRVGRPIKLGPGSERELEIGGATRRGCAGAAGRATASLSAVLAASGADGTGDSGQVAVVLGGAVLLRRRPFVRTVSHFYESPADAWLNRRANYYMLQLDTPTCARPPALRPRERGREGG